MLNPILADIASALKAFTLGDFLDILLVSFILYSFFRLIKDTKAYQMAIGLGIVLLLFLVSQWANLIVTQRIIRSFITYLIIAVIVLFQGELRRFLTSIGSRSFRKHPSFKSLIEKSEDVLLAIEYLSTKKIGALIAFEKEVSLNSYAKRGTEIDAVLSKDLLVSLFYPNSKAAGCLLPLPAAYKLGKHFQTRTRHLAALGLSQETDAAVIIVSEETGTISIATEGNLERELDKEQLKEYMLDYLK
jgi:diadenylate cyclase